MLRFYLASGLPLLFSHFFLLSTFAILLLVGSLTGCASKEKVDQPASVYFAKAMEMMEDEDYVIAIEQFEKLNAIHPFSQYSEQALLELAYAYYANGDRERCRATLGRFMRQYPNSEQFDYALYLRGVANFDEDRNLLHNSFGASPAKRSLRGAKIAFDDFTRLVNNYPNSRFALDARSYMIYIRDQLALKELSISEFYLEKNANIAALNRAQEVLQNFISSRHTPRAMELIEQAYQQMGMHEQAQLTRNKRKRYFPDHDLEKQAN